MLLSKTPDDLIHHARQAGEALYQRLGSSTLKTGETVEIGLVVPVDPPSTDRLKKLLGHKGWEWVYQIGLSLEGKTDDLENRFYVARRGDEILSNVCTFEKDGVGILAHVWTPEAERRKGLCTAILEKLIEDFRARGGGLLLLGTAFDSPPYHIYRKFAFVGYFDGSGLMRYGTEADFEAKYFSRGKTKVVEPTWGAWPKVNALLAEPEEYVKSIAYGKFYKADAEDCYIYLMHELGRNPAACARLLERTRNGAVVGCAWVVPNRLFPGTFLLDLYSHPNHPGGYGKLLEAMKWPSAKVVCCVESGQRRKARALRAAGFKREGLLRGQLRKRDAFADLLVFSR